MSSITLTIRHSSCFDVILSVQGDFHCEDIFGEFLQYHARQMDICAPMGLLLARTWFATRDYRASLMANPASPWPVRLKSRIMLYLLSIVWQYKNMTFFDEFEERAANEERNRTL